MRLTDMAVVISQSQNEIAEMAERGLDIKPHRKRMVEEDLEDKFKDPQDPLRIAFVCSMWTTGFDVPSLSTVYLDKPLRNHTLMQTITRANRVFPEKNNGLIVAYVDVFRNLQKALAIYAVGGKAGEVPVEEKGALVDALREAVDDLRAFCAERDVDLDALGRLTGFELVAAGKQTVEMLMVDDDEKIAFLSRARSGRPPLQGHPAGQAGQRVQPRAGGVEVPRRRHRRLHRAARRLGRHGPRRAAPRRVRRRPRVPDPRERRRGAVRPRRCGLGRASRRPSSRDGHAPRPSGCARCSPHGSPRSSASTRCASTWWSDSRSSSPTTTPAASTPRRSSRSCSQFSKTLTEEEARALSEGLTEEQLAIFDLLMRPAPELSEDEKVQVKKVAEELLTILKRDKLVLDWRKAAGHPRRRARRRRGDPRPAAREVHPRSLRAEVRRRLPARLRQLLGRRALGLRACGVSSYAGPHQALSAALRRSHENRPRRRSGASSMLSTSSTHSALSCFQCQKARQSVAASRSSRVG